MMMVLNHNYYKIYRDDKKKIYMSELGAESTWNQMLN